MMQGMKKIAAIFLALLFISPAYAHSGRTDSQGGHYNRSTGEYHFHHGYPAHQHENGVCPYDFDDKTGESSGTSGGGSSSKKPTIVKGTSNSDSAENDTSSSSSSSIPVSVIVIGCAVGGYGLLYLWAIISGAIYSRRYKKQWNAKQKELLDLYGGKTKFQIALECGMPCGVEIGPDGLPKEIGSDNWGQSLTFYVSPSGYAYHARPTCSKAASITTHAANLRNRSPCQRCHPCAPNMDWYWSYKRIMGELKTYQILPLDVHQDGEQLSLLPAYPSEKEV